MDMKSGQIRVLCCRIMSKEEGCRLSFVGLMMKLAFGSNEELMCMLMHIIRVGFERLKLPKMTYIISCQ